jgi:carbon-monoxide dehydrogenase medium subunit
MNLRLARPSLVIDINELPGLDSVDISTGSVFIGALVRHRALLQLTTLPLLAAAAARIGHPQVRNRGTIGGSVAHGDPAAELPACLVALGAVIVLEGSSGRREVPASEFFRGFLSTDIRDGEMVVGVRVDRPAGTVGTALVEQAPRYGDYAFAGIAVAVTRNAVCEAVSAAAISLADRTLDVSPAFGGLVGQSVLSRQAVDATVEHVDSLIEPGDDVHASARYRRQITRSVVAEALEQAWSASGGEVTR